MFIILNGPRNEIKMVDIFDDVTAIYLSGRTLKWHALPVLKIDVATDRIQETNDQSGVTYYPRLAWMLDYL
jgi:hypothetical protein